MTLDPGDTWKIKLKFLSKLVIDKSKITFKFNIVYSEIKCLVMSSDLIYHIIFSLWSLGLLVFVYLHLQLTDAILCGGTALFTCSLPVLCLVPDTNVCTVCFSGNLYFQPLILDL